MLFVIFDRSSEYLMPYVNAITSVFATRGICVQICKVVYPQ
jgi:hypothetical protein